MVVVVGKVWLYNCVAVLRISHLISEKMTRYKIANKK